MSMQIYSSPRAPCREAEMQPNKTALERAFELAQSGRCRNMHELARLLHQDGYSTMQLEGKSLRKQLITLIKDAAGAAAPD